jgi:hypothetical protein
MGLRERFRSGCGGADTASFSTFQLQLSMFQLQLFLLLPLSNAIGVGLLDKPHEPMFL